MSHPSAKRHVPTRTCAGCGQRSSKAEMRRFGLVLDASAADERRLEWRSQGGRGSYLHRSAECARTFVAKKKPVLGLRARVARSAREALVDEAALS